MHIDLNRKMFEAVFQILKDENSLELIIASYQLLHELDEVQLAYSCYFAEFFVFICSIILTPLGFLVVVLLI